MDTTTRLSNIEARAKRKRTDAEKLYKQERINFIRNMLEASQCRICGRTTKQDTRLCFHHIDPSTKECDVTQMKTCSWSRIYAEIDKCEVLCISCHTRLHYRTLNPEVKYCPQCQKEKPRSAFRESSQSDLVCGLYSWCRECDNKRKREYRKRLKVIQNGRTTTSN